MTQPQLTGRPGHRRDIHAHLCDAYDVIIDGAWRTAVEAKQFVGTCTRCGQPMRPLAPEQRGARTFYPAQCTGCGREVEGHGPRPGKEKGKQ